MMTRRSLLITGILAMIVLFCADISFASDSGNSTVVGRLVDQFYNKTTNWANVITGAAISLFRIVLILDVVLLGIQLILKRSELPEVAAEFVRLVFFAGIMYSIMVNYKEWSDSILRGFSSLGADLGYSKDLIEPNAFFKNSADLVKGVFESSMDAGVVVGIFGTISGLMLLVCFALMAARIIQITCESYVVMNAGIILLGFGGCGILREYAINFMRYAFSVPVKLFVLQLLMGLCTSFIADLRTVTPDMNGAITLVGVGLIMLVLTNTIPDIVGSIVFSANVPTGNALAQSTTAAMTTALAVMGAMGSGAYKGGAIASAANAAAKEEGLTGWQQKQRAAELLAKGWADAAKNKPADPHSFSDRMRSSLQRMREDALIKKSGSDSGE